MSSLSPEKALIVRITRIANVPWILANGLHCRSSAAQDPDLEEIGNPDLIEKRTRRIVPVPPGGTLSDYVPFYFTPYLPMLYNIKACTAPGFLDTRLRYAAWRRLYSSRASSGVRYASFSRRQHWRRQHWL